MPRGNATGPWGMGPLTGRGAGFCAGFAVPGYANPAMGRGFGGARAGLGYGGGHGWRHQYYATGLPGWIRAGSVPAAAPVPFAAGPTPEQETSALKAQQEYLTATLESVRKRLEELETMAAQ